MMLKEKIQRWQQEMLNGYCEKCKDTCCNGKKHNIIAGPNSVSLFKEKGIPIVKRSQFDTHSLRTNTLRFRNGCEIQKPSLVEMPGKWLYGDEWYVYADFCPFYKNNQCEVHEDERRPEVCKKYPLNFLGCNDSEGKLLDVLVMNSCEFFSREEVRKTLTKKFPVRIIDG